jgi:hypothetical protein
MHASNTFIGYRWGFLKPSLIGHYVCIVSLCRVPLFGPFVPLHICPICDYEAGGRGWGVQINKRPLVPQTPKVYFVPDKQRGNTHKCVPLPSVKGPHACTDASRRMNLLVLAPVPEALQRSSSLIWHKVVLSRWICEVEAPPVFCQSA